MPVDPELQARMDAEPLAPDLFVKGCVLIQFSINVEDGEETSFRWGYSLGLNQYEVVGLLRKTIQIIERDNAS